MEPKLVKELGELAERRRKRVGEVIAEAVKIGVEKLWQETVLDQYLKGKIRRGRTIKLVGLDKVKLVEKQKEVVLEDIKWGLHG